MKLVSVVFPAYNEEDVIELFLSELNEVLETIKEYEFELIAVNDGSKDRTLDLLIKAQEKYSNLRIISFSRNFGHEPAICAGLKAAEGDVVIPLDADLQDPPCVIPELIKVFEQGYDVVNAKRASRKEDRLFKKTTAKFFYRFIDKMSNKIKIPQNVATYRLMSRRVVNEVNLLTEKNRVLRVEVPFVGFRVAEVLFARPKRNKGQSKYHSRSMIKLALDSIVSTTTRPLYFSVNWAIKLAFLTGLSILLELIFYICFKCGIFNSIDVIGYYVWLMINIVAIMMTFLFVLIAILSQYVGRAFIEVQNRPMYIIEEEYPSKRGK